MAERHEKFLAQLYTIRILFDSERYGELVRLITEMLRENPDAGYLYYTRGLSLERLRRVDEAAVDYQAALLHNLDNLSAHKSLADFAFDREDNTTAISHYLEVLRLDPLNFRGWYQLGSIYSDQQNYAAAVEAYSKAIEIDATKAPLFFLLATTLEELADLNRALAAYDGGLRLNPNDAAALESRADLVARLG